MAVEDGQWIMRGLAWDNPYRIRTWRELVSWINEVCFLPLFANGIVQDLGRSILKQTILYAVYHLLLGIVRTNISKDICITLVTRYQSILIESVIGASPTIVEVEVVLIGISVANQGMRTFCRIIVL